MRPLLLLLVFLASLLGVTGAGSADAAFPGANGKIALDGIFTMNPDGSAHSQITVPPSGYSDWEPSWSADGQKLAFARLYAPDVETYDSSVYLANADGSGQTNVPNTGPTHVLSDPSLSPDGSKIAFLAGFSDLYTISTDGSGRTRITGSCMPCSAASPAWSPDGQKIAFDATGPSGHADVWVVNPDGTGLTNLTNDPGGGMMPAWSPDGTRIAFSSYYRNNLWEIWVMNADGSGEQRIETDAREPAWSPDGRKIAFIKDLDPGPGANDKLFTMNADGSGQTMLDTSYRPSGPDWQPLPAPRCRPHGRDKASVHRQGKRPWRTPRHRDRCDFSVAA
jgi:Tol biopolymer transport system component